MNRRATDRTPDAPLPPLALLIPLTVVLIGVLGCVAGLVLVALARVGGTP